MNHYTELLRYVRGLADEDPFVNTTTNMPFDEIDYNKGDLYLMFNIDIVGGGQPNNTITLDLELTSLQQRDTNKEINEDKFYLNDNNSDNFNETLAVLNRVVGKMRKDFGDTDISIDETPTYDKLRGAKTNTLDGWTTTFTVTMPNTNIDLCS